MQQLSTPICYCFLSTKPPQLPALALLPRPSPRFASASAYGPGSAARRLGPPPPPSAASAMRRRGRRRVAPSPAAATDGREAAAPGSQEKVMLWC